MASSNLKTVILRFRDLSVPDTIARHREICEQKEYVWWGWWAKPQERVPLEAFGALGRKIHENGELEIMLFDSGKRKIYTAKCGEISYKTDGEKQYSPDKECTPNYYSENDYLAWFKLTSISESLSDGDANRLLRKLSYYRVDEFFTSRKSPFSPFYNKKIYSTSELADQQRTIWFVRDAKPGDLNHEIHSYSDSLNNDKNVDECFRLLPTRDVLWLSDIHFSADHHAFLDEAGSNNQLYIRLHHELKNLNKTISHIIISGDLTYTASENEYNIAWDFVKNMNSLYDLHETSYSISPGNHDLKFSDSPYKPHDKIEIPFEESKECYTQFYHQVFGTDPTDTLYSIRRFLTPDLIPVELISVNSCALQQDKNHFRGMGYVGNDQMNAIEEKLSKTDGSGTLRILVMHHHLLPVMFSEKPEVSKMYSMTLDSEAISQFVIKNNIKLVLHGHAHKGFYSEIIRQGNGEDKPKQKYYVVGIGSAGAIQKDLSDGATNMFGDIVFNKETMNISIYSLFANGQKSKEIITYRIPYCETL